MMAACAMCLASCGNKTQQSEVAEEEIVNVDENSVASDSINTDNATGAVEEAAANQSVDVEQVLKDKANELKQAGEEKVNEAKQAAADKVNEGAQKVNDKVNEGADKLLKGAGLK